MEGTGVHEVRHIAKDFRSRKTRAFIVIVLEFIASLSFAQSFVPAAPPPTSIVPMRQIWINDPALFLEPNNFSVIKDFPNRSLWLRVGYGTPILQFFIPESPAVFDTRTYGVEALAWSRLQALSDFRFPVETVDYMFGLYVVQNRLSDSWRLRITHISSHDVDGKDSVAGGSSSHYSREFVELMRQWNLYRESIIFKVGLRALFHQVTHIEPWFQVPASLMWRISGNEYSSSQLNALAGTAGGPVWPALTGGIQYGLENSSINQRNGYLEFALLYYYGASWAGTDAGAKVSQLKLQLDVRGL